MKTTAAWVAWMIVSLVFLLSTRNPFYLLISTVLLLLLGQNLANKKDQTAWVVQNFRFLTTMILLSTLINALFTHVGQAVLFTIPEQWPLVGGNITLESIAYGAINGLVIGNIYLLFNIFNQALSIQQITRLIPRAFHSIAMIVTIALTFFPSIQERTREIKEAQMIRGNPMKKAADWLPILMPLLITSLEKAFLLSESMTTRGFHTLSNPPHTLRNLVGLILTLFCIFAGWVLGLYNYPKILSAVLYLVGGVILFVFLISTSRQNQVTQLHQETWKLVDVFLLLLFVVSLSILLIYILRGDTTGFNYSPYPRLLFPKVAGIEVIVSLVPGIPLIGHRHD